MRSVRKHRHRGNKQYGPVKKRGLAKRLKPKIKQQFLVPPNTLCLIRKPGANSLVRHVTQRFIVCTLLWRN